MLTFHSTICAFPRRQRLHNSHPSPSDRPPRLPSEIPGEHAAQHAQSRRSRRARPRDRHPHHARRRRRALARRHAEALLRPAGQDPRPRLGLPLLAAHNGRQPAAHAAPPRSAHVSLGAGPRRGVGAAGHQDGRRRSDIDAGDSSGDRIGAAARDGALVCTRRARRVAREVLGAVRGRAAGVSGGADRLLDGVRAPLSHCAERRLQHAV